MTTTARAAEESIPRDGSLVEVRGQRWVVSDSSPGSDGSTLLTRVNLLLADDVGLGKTIEAGLVALELLLRHRTLYGLATGGL